MYCVAGASNSLLYFWGVYWRPHLGKQTDFPFEVLENHLFCFFKGLHSNPQRQVCLVYLENPASFELRFDIEALGLGGAKGLGLIFRALG